MHPSLREHWDRHARIFTVRSALKGSSFPIETAPADVEPGDLKELVSKRYIEKTCRSRVKGTVRVVWVPEAAKRRRRLVTHPKWQNELPFVAGPDRFARDDEVFAHVREESAACVDMRAFFNQFELIEEL